MQKRQTVMRGPKQHKNNLIQIKREIIQSDALSASWFYLAISPPSIALRRPDIGSQIKGLTAETCRIYRLHYPDDFLFMREP